MSPVYGIYVVLLTLGKVYSTVLIKEVHREIHIQHVSTMSESGTGLAEHDVPHSSIHVTGSTHDVHCDSIGKHHCDRRTTPHEDLTPGSALPHQLPPNGK